MSLRQPVWCALVLMLSVSASLSAADADTQPKDYAREIELLQQEHAQWLRNNEEYAQINDSLFLSMPQDEWVATFLRRGAICSRVYFENQRCIEHIVSFLSDPDVPEAAVDEVMQIYKSSYLSTDIFLNEGFAKLLLPYYTKPGDDRPSSRLNQLYLKVGYALSESRYLLMGDNGALRTYFQLLIDVIDNYRPGQPGLQNVDAGNLYAMAYTDLLDNTIFIKQRLMTVAEMRTRAAEARSILTDEATAPYILGEARLKMANAVLNIDNNLYRNIYLTDRTHRYDALRDSVTQVMLRRYQSPAAYARLDLTNKVRVEIARMEAGVQTPMTTYCTIESLWKRPSWDEISNEEIQATLSAMTDAIYCLDLMELPESDTRKIILDYCADITQIIRHKRTTLDRSKTQSALNLLATYGLIHKYLKPEESKHFLESLVFFSQPFTRAHSQGVTNLSLALLRGVIRYQPELLCTLEGIDKPRQVKGRASELLSLMEEGARFHDVGKTRIPDIIRTDFRRLTDHEYQLVKRHPEFGLSYLRVTPSLQRIADLVVGHHKWYNGQSYPDAFDNTKSPLRILIDVLTIADCLEAGTSRLGRFYRSNKRFDDILLEFRERAGMQYNPDLINLIVEHTDVQDEMRQLVDVQWRDVYYRVFSENYE